MASFTESLQSMLHRESLEKSIGDIVSPIKAVGALGKATSCLAIACGPGFTELELTALCMPNITRLVVVEPDHAAVQQLQAMFKERMPQVQCQAIESKAQDVGETAFSPVDVIIMVYNLYHFDDAERKALFAKFPKWLTHPEGRVFLVTSDQWKSEKSLNDIFTRVGKPVATWETAEPELAAVGLKKEVLVSEPVKVDLSNPDPGLLRLVRRQSRAPQSVTDDQLKAAIAEVFPNGIMNGAANMGVLKFA